MQSFEHDEATRKILARTLVDRVPTEPEPLSASRALTRGTTIVGLMLEHLGDRRGGWKRPGGAVARFGQIAWALVELAAPRSMGEILFQYWIGVLYAMSALMLAIGLLTGAPAVTRAGCLVLGASLLVNIVVEKLRRWMVTGNRRDLKPIVLAIPLLLSALSSLALVSAMNTVNKQLARNGVDAGSGLAGRLKSPSDVDRVFREHEPNREVASHNVKLMAENLGWDSLFILSYATGFLCLGWILATQFDRPYRAFAWVVVSTGATVVFDSLENFQAYRALQGSTWLATGDVTSSKFAAAGLTIAVLLIQAFAVRLDRSSAAHATRRPKPAA